MKRFRSVRVTQVIAASVILAIGFGHTANASTPIPAQQKNLSK